MSDGCFLRSAGKCPYAKYGANRQNGKDTSFSKSKITVSGTVLDKTTNEPLIGVSVVVKGVANAGTITDMDGKFTLKLPYAEAPLVFPIWDTNRRKLFPVLKRADCLVAGRYKSLAGGGGSRLH